MTDMQMVIIGLAVVALVLIIWKRQAIIAWLRTFRLAQLIIGWPPIQAVFARPSADQAAPAGPDVSQEVGGEAVIQGSGITASRDSTAKVTQEAQDQAEIDDSGISTAKGQSRVRQKASGKGKIKGSGITIK